MKDRIDIIALCWASYGSRSTQLTWHGVNAWVIWNITLRLDEEFHNMTPHGILRQNVVRCDAAWNDPTRRDPTSPSRLNQVAKSMRWAFIPKATKRVEAKHRWSQRGTEGSVSTLLQSHVYHLQILLPLPDRNTNTDWPSSHERLSRQASECIAEHPAWIRLYQTGVWFSITTYLYYYHTTP